MALCSSAGSTGAPPILLYLIVIAGALQPAKRPTGVTIIAILNIIGGIIMLIVGLALVAVGAIFPALPSSAFEPQIGEDIDLSGIPPSLLGGAAIAIGGVIVAIGIASFVVAYGLLKGIGWAWTLTVVLSIISIVLNAISLATGNFGGIISIIISAVILYYVYRSHVKAYFGKGVKAAAPS